MYIPSLVISPVIFSLFAKKKKFLIPYKKNVFSFSPRLYFCYFFYTILQYAISFYKMSNEELKLEAHKLSLQAMQNVHDITMKALNNE